MILCINFIFDYISPDRFFTKESTPFSLRQYYFYCRNTHCLRLICDAMGFLFFKNCDSYSLNMGMHHLIYISASNYCLVFGTFYLKMSKAFAITRNYNNQHEGQGLTLN